MEDEDDGKHIAPALAQRCSSRGGRTGGEEVWREAEVSGSVLWVVPRLAQKCSRREHKRIQGAAGVEGEWGGRGGGAAKGRKGRGRKEEEKGRRAKDEGARRVREGQKRGSGEARGGGLEA